MKERKNIARSKNPYHSRVHLGQGGDASPPTIHSNQTRATMNRPKKERKKFT